MVVGPAILETSAQDRFLGWATPTEPGCESMIEEAAEAYLMRRLSPDLEHAYADHYITCGRCAGTLEETEAVRNALQEV